MEAIGDKLKSMASEAYDHILTPIGHTVSNVFSSLESLTGAAKSGFDAAKFLPWFLLGLVVLIVILIFFKPQILTTLLAI